MPRIRALAEFIGRRKTTRSSEQQGWPPPVPATNVVGGRGILTKKFFLKLAEMTEIGSAMITCSNADRTLARIRETSSKTLRDCQTSESQMQAWDPRCSGLEDTRDCIYICRWETFLMEHIGWMLTTPAVQKMAAKVCPAEESG